MIRTGPSGSSTCGVVFLTVTTLLLCLLASLPSLVDGGIIQGFHNEVPSVEEVTPTFEKIQRQFLVEAGVTNENDITSIIDGRSSSSSSSTATTATATDESQPQQAHRRTQTGSGPELSFMIVSLVLYRCR